MTPPVGGIDPHQDTFTVGIVDPHGVEITHETFPNTDAVDAVASARALLAEPTLGPAQTLEVYDPAVAEIEAVLEHRRAFVAARTLMLHHVGDQIAKLPTEIRDQLTTNGKIEARPLTPRTDRPRRMPDPAGRHRLGWLQAFIDQDRTAATARTSATSSAPTACTGAPPGARSLSVPSSRRRARQRCTRPSQTCGTPVAHVCPNPAATAPSTVLPTSSLASAGTLAGTGPLSPSRTFAPDNGQLDRLDLDRLGEPADLCGGRFELPVPFGGRATRLAGQRSQRRVGHRPADRDDPRHIYPPLPGRVGLGDLCARDLQADLPLRLRGQLPRSTPTLADSHLMLLHASARTRSDLVHSTVDPPRQSQTHNSDEPPVG